MSRSRCSRCRRVSTHCFCAEVPRLASSMQVLILQHPSESAHALNTATIAALGLVNAELLVGEVFEELPARLQRDGRRAILLFPGEGASEPQAGTGESLLLVVLDGTWRKARKLIYLNPVLQTLPRLTLPIGPGSRYRLRKAPGPGCLSTLEAIVSVLNICEDTRRFDALLQPFERMIDRQIEAMGEALYRRHHPDADQRG